MSTSESAPEGWKILTSSKSGFRYFFDTKARKSYWVCENAEFGWSWFFNSQKKKSYFNIITKEVTMTEPPEDPLAIKRKKKKLKKAKKKAAASAASSKSVNEAPARAPAAVAPVMAARPRKLLDYRNPKNSPHVQQAFLNKGYTSTYKPQAVRELKPDAPTAKYRRRKDEIKTVVSWEERRLLIGEIEFLIEYYKRTRLVVYVGQPFSDRMDCLTKLFPELKFHIFPFEERTDGEVDETERIVKKKYPFTDKDAEHYKLMNPRPLYIHNRLHANSAEQNADFLKQDFQLQKRWVQQIRPTKTLLFMRLPYEAGQTSHFTGRLFLPVWGKPTTTELALIPNHYTKMSTYDHTKIEKQMFFFNTCTRVNTYRHSVCAEGIDFCYDCTCEVFVLYRYLRKRHPDWDKKIIAEKIAALSAHLSQALDPTSV